MTMTRTTTVQHRVRRLLLISASVSFVASFAWAESLPVIKNRQLLVDGKPFLAIGGELHNSSASSPEFMQPLWDKLQKMHVRTVIGTVSWEDFERVEGSYDYSAVDAQIAQARRRDMRLVLIWFGAFKNATSTYAPRWVRENPSRFPRAVAQGGMKEAFNYIGAMPKPVLSVFSPRLMEADRAAFVALMKHLAEVDTDHRVIMVQVNNEVGLLRDSRDRSALAAARRSCGTAAAQAVFRKALCTTGHHRADEGHDGRSQAVPSRAALSPSRGPEVGEGESTK